MIRAAAHAPVDGGQSNAMVAYLVLAHRNTDQLRLLVATLAAEPRSVIYLHMDARVAPPAWISGSDLDGRVKLVPPIAVHWAGFSMVEATLRLLRDALDDPRNSYFVLLSGTCCPIRPMREVNDLLSRPDVPPRFGLWKIVLGPGALPRPEERQAIVKRHWLDLGFLNPSRGKVRRLLWRLAEAINTILPYTLPITGDVVKGSQWFGADRRLAGELIRQSPALEPEFRHSFAPDEMMFQTIYYRDRRRAGESPSFIEELDMRQAFHFIAFRPPERGSRSWIEQVRTTVDPRLLDLPQLDEIVASGALFARKCTPALAAALQVRNHLSNSQVRTGA